VQHLIAEHKNTVFTMYHFIFSEAGHRQTLRL